MILAYLRSLAARFLCRSQTETAEKASAILDAHKVAASSWTDTKEYRGEIRRSAEKVLKTLAEKQG